MRRAVLVAAAVLVAPLATPLTIWLAFTVFYLLGLGWFADKPYRLVLGGGVLAWSFFATPLAYLMTLVGGVPASLVLLKKRWVGLRHFVALGLVLGVLPFVIVDIVAAIAELLRRAHSIEIPFTWPFIGMGALCGIASATAFWVVAVKKGPENMVDQLGSRKGIRVLGALIEVGGLLVIAGAYLLIPNYLSQHNTGLIGGVVLLTCGPILTIASMTRQPIPFVRSIAAAVAVAAVGAMIWTGVFLALWVQVVHHLV